MRPGTIVSVSLSSKLGEKYLIIQNVEEFDCGHFECSGSASDTIIEATLVCRVLRKVITSTKKDGFN